MDDSLSEDGVIERQHLSLRWKNRRTLEDITSHKRLSRNAIRTLSHRRPCAHDEISLGFASLNRQWLDDRKGVACRRVDM